MTISRRLYLVFALLAASLVLCGAMGIAFLLKSHSRFEYVQDHTIPGIADIDKIVAQSTALRILLNKQILAADEPKRAKVETRIAATLDKLDELVGYYNKNDVSDATDQRMTDAMRADLANVRTMLPAFLAKADAGDHEGAVTMLADDTTGIGAAIQKLLADLNAQITYNIKLGNDLRTANKAAFQMSFWVMLLGVAAVLLGVGAFGLSVVRGVKLSLNGMRAAMTEMQASLDLTRAAPVRRMDEIGQTAAAFNALLEQFRNVIGSVVLSTDSVRTGAQEISSGNTDLSSRTEEQAASLEETAASMTQLTETVKQNADNAREANRLATDATETADLGNEAVQGMVHAIGKISGSSSKISEITGVIESIAFQTNILALNAAVEAARAGELGRGFAVVASEVRNLAQRSSAAAKEIKDLIESSVILIRDGAQQAVKAGETMGDVKQAIKNVSDIVGAIAAASEEQSRGIEQVNQAVNQMDQVTQQNAALVEQAAAAAQSLEEQARSLKVTVSVFRLGGTSPSTPPSAMPQGQYAFSG
ncbi:HAMP domain-containing protein [Trinickia terrae]|uniref:HAMP domain-containing protein n=2 Tax=Trinickia terrae TaxID=2571161 RepID=A0A4U1HPU3_9BURK|nr:HAMP domain-containing protein [Trinickia terrae]